MIGAAGVVSMAVLGSSDVGRVWVSTYRGRPPGKAELEKVQAFNMTDQEGPRSLPYTDSEVQVDGQPITARMAFVPASAHYNSDRWAVLLFGADYSASVSLDGLTPDRIVLTMAYDDAGYTDMKTAVRHHPT